MGIDIHTLIIIISISNLLQVAALFFQYSLNKVYNGVGWWLLGTAFSAIGYGLLFLRGIIPFKLITVILANSLILTGFILIYIGVMRFLERKESRRVIISVSAVFIISFLYYTFGNDDITMRTVVVYSAVAIISLLTAKDLFINKTESIMASANFNSIVYLLYGLFFTFRAMVTLTVDPVNTLFTPTVIQAVSFIFLFIYGILLTFGQIIMLNQRLNSDNLKDKENMEMVFNTSPDSVLVTRLHDGLIVKINDGFLNLTGFGSDDVIGKSVIDLDIWHNPDDRQRFLKLLSEKGFCENEEFTFYRKDSTPFIGLLSAKVFSLIDTPHIITVTRDITGHKKIEAELRESEKKFRHLIENSHDIIYTLTPEGVFTFVSPAWTVLLGHPVSQVQGHSFMPFVHPDDVSVCMLWLQKVIETGERLEGVEYRVRHIDGRWFWHTSSAVPLRDEDGKVIAFEGTARDITRRKIIEQELKEREEQLRNIFVNAPVGIFHSNWDGHFVEVNPALAEMLGYSSSEELISAIDDMTTQIYADPEVRPQIMEALKNTDGWIHFDEITWKRKDNCLITIDMTGRRVYNSAGGFSYLEGFIEDITERKLAENALRESSQKLEAIISASPDGIGMVSLDGKLQLISDRLALMYGYTLEQKDELIGKVIIDFIDPSNHKLLTEHIHNLMYGRGKGRNDNRIVEYLALKKDNTRFYAEVKYAVLSDSQGDPVNILFVERDITEHKLAGEALRESEEKLNTLFSSMTEMVVLHELVFDKNGEAVDYRITDCNNAFTEIIGIQKNDAVGKPATEVYHTETAPFLEEYARVALTGDPYEYTTYYEPLDKHFSISVVSPKKNNFATITTDVTGIRKIQAEIFAKNEELENYLYIASHDLRSPLVNIQGFSNRLQRQTNLIKTIISNSELPSEDKADIDSIIEEGIPKSLKYIFSSVNKMDNLLAGLLHLSRTGRTLMTISKVDINQLFGTIINNYNFQLTELDASVIISDLPPCYGDENLLNQLFSNIIGNAIKYRDKNRKLKLNITARTEFTKVIYSIKDNGPGIEQRHLEKIWDIFYKVDSGQPDAGDGLGLSIVKRIAEKHNGKVSVESEPGKGSVFYIELHRNEFTV